MMRRTFGAKPASAAAAAAALLLLLASVATVSATPRALSSLSFDARTGAPGARRLHDAATAAAAAAAANPGVATDADAATTSGEWPEGMPGLWWGAVQYAEICSIARARDVIRHK